jgi:hypothetical protein
LRVLAMLTGWAAGARCGISAMAPGKSRSWTWRSGIAVDIVCSRALFGSSTVAIIGHAEP